MTAGTTTGYAGIGRRAGTPRPILENRLRARRKELGLRQYAVAERAEIAPAQLHRYEVGDAGCHVWTALKLARALDTTVEALFLLPEGDR